MSQHPQESRDPRTRPPRISGNKIRRLKIGGKGILGDFLVWVWRLNCPGWGIPGSSPGTALIVLK